MRFYDHWTPEPIFFAIQLFVKAISISTILRETQFKYQTYHRMAFCSWEFRVSALESWECAVRTFHKDQ
jgi:hypothetical protein